MIYFIDIKKDINGIFKINNIINQGTGEFVSLVDFLMKDGIVFVNNLDFSFMEISKQLIKMKYRNVFHAENKKQFSFVYRGGECLQIRIIHNNRKIFTIVNFEKKFLQDYGDYETNSKLVNYANENQRLSSSLGNDAFNEFLRLTFKNKGQQLSINACREIFRRDYPIIKDDMLENAKQLTHGFQMAKQGYYENIYNYDICSSFPSQLADSTPRGAPKEYNSFDELPKSYFYVAKLTFIRVKLKKGCIDFANADKKNIITLVLTEHLHKLFINNYDFEICKVKRLLGFKTIKNRFDAFLFKNIINGKIQANYKPIIKYNKAIANSIIGYFGKNTETDQTKIINKNGKIAILTTKIKKEPVYLPLYLYATGKAKQEFIIALQRIGLDKIIYCNTDGFLSSTPININLLNLGRDSDLGAFKEKPIFSKIYINCVNGYCAQTIDGELDNTLSGMRTPDKISVEQYRNNSFKYLINCVNQDGDIQEIEIDR